MSGAPPDLERVAPGSPAPLPAGRPPPGSGVAPSQLRRYKKTPATGRRLGWSGSGNRLESGPAPLSPRGSTGGTGEERRCEPLREREAACGLTTGSGSAHRVDLSGGQAPPPGGDRPRRARPQLAGVPGTWASGCGEGSDRARGGVADDSGPAPSLAGGGLDLVQHLVRPGPGTSPSGCETRSDWMGEQVRPGLLTRVGVPGCPRGGGGWRRSPAWGGVDRGDKRAFSAEGGSGWERPGGAEGQGSLPL